MEHTRTLELKVGLAVGLGLLLFVVTLFLLGGESLFQSSYNLKVKFDSVQGLAPGSVVQVLGIPVGNVRSIDVEPIGGKNQLVVNMKITSGFKSQITLGSVAGVRTQGALGDKFVYITPGSAGARPLEEDEVLETEKSGSFLDTLVESGDQLQKVFKIIDEIHVLMTNINGGNRSEALMSNLRKSSGHLASILEKVDNGNGTLGLLINDRSVFDGIKRYVGNPQEKFMKNVIRETIQTNKK